MSLKARIEAVIYAAEEPVTLAQLAFLFGGEVLEAAPATSPALPATSETADPALQLTSHEAAGSSQQSTHTAEAGTSPAEGPAPPAESEHRKAARIRERTIREALRTIVAELIADYSAAGRGMEIREIAGGYRVATKPEYHDTIRSFVKSLKPPMKLSLQALETLAVVAYKQPVTSPEVGAIRGADSAAVLGGLMSRKLIATAGRKQVIGRPILYKTTKEFLMRFGLKDLNELPSIEEFEKMAGDIDLDEEDIPVPGSAELPFEPGEDAPNLGSDEATPNDQPSDHTATAETEAATVSAAVEANAGEAGVAVSAPVETASPDFPPLPVENASVPDMIELDSRLAEEVAPANHGPGDETELITAVHPSTTVGGE